MGPPVVVRGYHDRRVQDGCGRGRAHGVEGERAPAELRRHPCGTGEQDRRVHAREPARHLHDDADGGVVAADVDRRKARTGDDEPGDLAVDVAVVVPGRILGAVHRRHGGDRDVPAAALDEVRRPRLHSDGPGAQLGRGRGAREHQRGGDGERAAAVVEVVGVDGVADQYHVDRSERVLIDGRPGGLGEVAVGTRGVEGRVGDDAETAEIEDGRRSAQHRHRAVLPG